MTAIGAVEVDDLWDVLKAQLLVPAVTDLLGKPGDAGKAARVFTPSQLPPDPQEGTLFGRVVLVAVNNPFLIVSSDAQMLDVPFLTLVEFVPWTAAGWNVARTMSAVQHAIYLRLRAFVPALQHALALSPVTMNRPAQSHPLRDAETQLWYSSAEYVCRVAAKP